MDEHVKTVNEHYLDTYVRPADARLSGVNNTWLGANGNTLSQFLINKQPGYGLDAAIAAQGDLYVFSYGVNDVRAGSTDQSELITMLRQAIDGLRNAVTNADFLLWIPATFLLTDFGQHYVVPNSAAQAYSDILRNAYRAIADEWPNVAVFDSQAKIFGEVSLAANPLMQDQIHPSPDGIYALQAGLVEIMGA